MFKTIRDKRREAILDDVLFAAYPQLYLCSQVTDIFIVVAEEGDELPIGKGMLVQHLLALFGLVTGQEPHGFTAEFGARHGLFINVG